MMDTDTAPSIHARGPLRPLPPDVKAWRQAAVTQLLCVIGLLLPIAAVATWVYLSQKGGMTLGTLFLGPLLGGGALIFWILFLHLIVCGDGLGALGLRRDRLEFDLLVGAGLATALLGFHFAFSAVAPLVFPPRPAVPGILLLISGVARDPWLLALWLGPVAWIGAALFEELARAFLLRRLWLSWPDTTGRWGAIVIVSAVMGLVHAYQGSGAAVSVGIQSLLLGWVFLRSGRLWALVVSHALYDSVQIVLAVVTIRQMGL